MKHQQTLGSLVGHPRRSRRDVILAANTRRQRVTPTRLKTVYTITNVKEEVEEEEEEEEVEEEEEE